ncbi:MAG: hypothetical protein K2K32_10090 [Muribaculaceae bacterium]|nr:hypothetical protein [Muribaculaceae bacterium]
MGKVKDIFDGIASFGKVVLMSGRPSKAGKDNGRKLIIMGTGPSLKEAMKNCPDIMHDTDTLAVNFTANTELYGDLKPKLYVLADSNFFSVDDNGNPVDGAIANLWENIGATDWEMTLYVPCKVKIPDSIAKNVHITLKRFNMTPAEGLLPLVHWLYRKGLAMPRPRNVLIASIMVALRDGYKNIYLIGADHSWTRDLRVDEDNHVVYGLNHYYKDSDKEHKRVKNLYENIRLHDMLNSLVIAFKSYHQISRFADELGAKITNCTPGSFIDAFPRASLSVIKEKIVK